MAFNFDINAGPISLSIYAAPGHLSIFCGRNERGFVLESGHGKNENGKLVEVWRNDRCGSLNAAAFGLHLVATPWRKYVRKSATT
jgi:hypothetical protein